MLLSWLESDIKCGLLRAAEIDEKVAWKLTYWSSFMDYAEVTWVPSDWSSFMDHAAISTIESLRLVTINRHLCRLFRDPASIINSIVWPPSIVSEIGFSDNRH